MSPELKERFERACQAAVRAWPAEGQVLMLSVARCGYSRGDLLWVKETWCEYDGDDCRYEYRADNPDPLSLKWRSPLFMPRVASRLSLRVIDVRVQRLHDITEEDARAEGVEPRQRDGARGLGRSDDWSYIGPYHDRWEKLNGKRAPWATNPVVEVPTFERVPHG